jgi:hypothetical protein
MKSDIWEMKLTIERLQRVQNCAARLITGAARRDHISAVLRDLHWLPVQLRIDFKILLLACKCINGTAPVYLRGLLTLYCPQRALRSADKLLLQEPRSRSVTYGDRAFACAAPRLWNKLPSSLRASSDVSAFKKDLKTFLFSGWSSRLSC